MDIIKEVVNISEEITDDWVGCFGEEENQNGFFWRMAARGILPDGVNPNDERVKALCRKAAKQLLGQSDK